MRGSAGPSGELGRAREGEGAWAVCVGKERRSTGLSCWVLGWVPFLLTLLFLFLFKLTQSNLFEFKIEFEFNSNTQTNKIMLQHECINKVKPKKKKFKY